MGEFERFGVDRPRLVVPLGIEQQPSGEFAELGSDGFEVPFDPRFVAAFAENALRPPEAPQGDRGDFGSPVQAVEGDEVGDRPAHFVEVVTCCGCVLIGHREDHPGLGRFGVIL
ncbi:hypothetical protein AB0L88_31200 [Saccharopolyspora shandongensis]|uniref:hypothetical protein n=1 Tax=Saccharopolyspora shandongensis TaxID=418495 RepID=UPI003424DFAD